MALRVISILFALISTGCLSTVSLDPSGFACTQDLDCAGLLKCQSGRCGTGSVVIEERFDADAASFTTTGGAWTVAGGRYQLDGPVPSPDPTFGNANLALHATVVRGDFELSVTAQTRGSSSPWDDFCVVVHYVDPDNYVYASFSEQNDAYVHGLFEIVGGIQRQTVDFKDTVLIDHDYSVQIIRRGRSLEVLRDGLQVGLLSDLAAPPGKVGFGSRDDRATFEDFLVRAEP